MKQDALHATKFLEKYLNMNNIDYMMEALKEAKKAHEEKEVPVGAIVVLNGSIIGRGHNSRIADNRISAHAEIKPSLTPFFSISESPLYISESLVFCFFFTPNCYLFS